MWLVNLLLKQTFLKLRAFIIWSLRRSFLHCSSCSLEEIATVLVCIASSTSGIIYIAMGSVCIVTAAAIAIYQACCGRERGNLAVRVPLLFSEISILFYHLVRRSLRPAITPPHRRVSTLVRILRTPRLQLSHPARMWQLLHRLPYPLEQSILPYLLLPLTSFPICNSSFFSRFTPPVQFSLLLP